MQGSIIKKTGGTPVNAVKVNNASAEALKALTEEKPLQRCRPYAPYPRDLLMGRSAAAAFPTTM